MPLKYPAEYTDRAEDWYQFFARNRGARVLEMVTDEIVEEHRSNPTQTEGHHSVQLHEILNFLRSMPIIGKEFVYIAVPYERYHVGYITERGAEATIDFDVEYATETEAMHDIFLRRLNRIREMAKGQAR